MKTIQYTRTPKAVLSSIRSISMTVALLWVLSSCTTTHYTKPETDISNLYRTEVSVADTAGIAAIPWKEYFPDTALQSLIEEVLYNNLDLRIAYIRIQQAEASLSMARGAYFPNVSLVGQVTDRQTSTGTNGTKVLAYGASQYSLGISANWELDVWGKLRSQSKARYAQFLSSQAYRDLIQTSLIANIATSYYSLLALDEQLAITHQTVSLLEENLLTMELLRESGQQNGAAVEQSKALLYRTQVTIPALETQIRTMENSISLLLGRRPDAIERTHLDNQQLPASMALGIPAQMLARRPDVRQAELSFRSAFELTNAARTSFYPSLTLGTAAIGYESTSLSSFFKPEHIFASIIGGLTQPLFARRQLTGNLKIAKAQQEEALLNFERTVLTAGKEVSDILFAYRSSLRKNETRQKEVVSLDTAVYYTQELLVAGEANYTEVLSAEQNLIQARLSQVNDKLEQLQYSVELYRALGGGTE